MCNCALLTIFLSLLLTLSRKWETFISYEELVHHLNCLNPETGVLDKGHQMGSSSWSMKTTIREIMSSAALCVAANKGKQINSYRFSCKNWGRCQWYWSTIINGSGWVFAITLEVETAYRCLLAENVNICPKHFKTSQFQNSIRLVSYFCIIFIVVYPFIVSLPVFNCLTSLGFSFTVSLKPTLGCGYWWF